MADDPVTTISVAARIAALKLDQVGRSPSESGPVLSNDRPRPRPPIQPRSSRPPLPDRRKTANNPPSGSGSTESIGNQPNESGSISIIPPPLFRTNTTHTDKILSRPVVPPRLPARKSAPQRSPVLPPRRPSVQGEGIDRRTSTDSISSAISTASSVSALSVGTAITSTSRSPSKEPIINRIKAPVFDAASLPPLPPKRSESDQKSGRLSSKTGPSSSYVLPASKVSPSLPPRLPSRQSQSPETQVHRYHDQASQAPARSALSFALNKSTEAPPQVPVRNPTAAPTPDIAAVPPPIPFASRPKTTTAHATNTASSSQIGRGCLLCRDFEAVDAHTARFPRHSLPQNSPIDYLSHALTSPFSSPTDKARAIFTWLHHNISYDVVAFFTESVKPSTPSGTVSSGLAVCEGYAGLYCALAIKAELECIVVSGHGKGYGADQIVPGSAVPPYAGNHAWNAVKIDGGEWKLLDACWGAGTVQGPDQPYNKMFLPQFFTMSNEEFALKHFPSDRHSFFFSATSGKNPPSWEDYMLGGEDAGRELMRPFTDARVAHSLSETGFVPKYKAIPVASSSSSPTAITHFQFCKVCPHWDLRRQGPNPGAPYCFILAVRPDSARQDQAPFEFDESRGIWWCDVRTAELGKKGDLLSVFAVTMLGDREDPRGVDAGEWRRVKGRVGWSGSAVAQWVVA